MTKSKVFFADLRSDSKKDGPLEKTARLFDGIGGAAAIGKDDLVAIKLTFSEVGNTAYLRPNYLRPIIERVKQAGGKPFLTDANTLYRGGRANAVDHLQTAFINGFSYSALGVPVIIADGLTGRNFVEVEINQKHVKAAKIGGEVFYADALISAAHIHAHMYTGFAGTFKNIGMGLGTRAGKQVMHSGTLPAVDESKCTGCGECVRWCPVGAIKLVKGKARIDQKICLGCGECTAVCPARAIAIRWIDEIPKLQERIVEYAAAVLKDKKGKALFFSFLLNVTPDCLCAGFNDAPIVPDVGTLSSLDPVAIEQAAFDLVNREEGLKSSRLKTAHAAGRDKFKDLFPDVDSEHLFRYAEEIGLGSREYELVKV